MDILFITRNRSGRGGHILVVNLVKQLRTRGHTVTLVAFKPEGEADFPDCEVLWEGSNAVLIPIAASDDYNEQMSLYISAGTDYLRKNAEKFDRVILDSWFTMGAGINAGIITEKVYHLAQSSPVFKPKDSSKIWESLFFDLLPRYPVQRIVPSEADAALYREQYRQTCSVLPLYLSDAFHQSSLEIHERSPLRLVTSAADFNLPQKGLDFLLDSLKTFTGFPFTLTLISGKPIERDLTNFPFSIELQSADSPEKMVALLQESDIYLCTSRKESFCFALAEALAMGMPAIALDSVGNRDYKTGFAFIENDTDFLPTLATFQDKTIREEWAARAKRSVSEYRLDRTIDVFNEIISR